MRIKPDNSDNNEKKCNVVLFFLLILGNHLNFFALCSKMYRWNIVCIYEKIILYSIVCFVVSYSDGADGG